jgi:hypothetical protein
MSMPNTSPRILDASVCFWLLSASSRASERLARSPMRFSTRSVQFRNLSIGGRHLHHMVFGIGGLLGVGYLWLVLLGVSPKGKMMSQATAVGYGVASAMTLDEFALWLNLEDVYWAKQGRQSVDAVALFGGLLSIGIWGGPFMVGVARELRRLVR